MHVDLLKGVPLLKHLSDADLERIDRLSREEAFAPETDIVEIGDPGHSLYIILDGTVQVLYPARSAVFELARLSAGDFFGEMALLNDMPRSATVRTVDACRLLVLDKEEFRSIIRESPEVALQLLEIMSVRIRNADEQISGLSEKAIRDPLTSLLNRRAFHERLGGETDRARRYGDSFALIMMDLDRFKSVNDTFGHDVGDDLLRWVGRLLSEHTRGADAAFRIGGEEFAVLAPGTGPSVAAALSRRLVEIVGEAKPPSTVDLKVTVSAGWATCPEHGSQPETLFNVADQALLRAKAGGRNRVCDPE